jgi:hypothetical protein
MPQITRQRDVVLKRAYFFGRDRLSDPQLNGAMMLVQQLMRQQSRSHARMQEPEQLEQRAICTQKIYRKHHYMSEANQPRDIVIPLRVHHSSLFQVQVCHFAGRKDAQ